MNKLKEYLFSELYEMSSGISSKPEQAGYGHPFISFRTVFNNHYLPEEISDLMDTSEKERNIYSVKEGDIFLTRTSETLDELGMSCVAVTDYPNTTFSGFLKRLRPKYQNVVHPKYLAFYLRSKYFRKTMANNSIMTLRASLNEQIFSYLKLLLPSYSEQEKIGNFLFLFYRKIELNNKINAELEAMAKTIYDYWFVQFDFPDKNGKPYKSSGGKMVYNEELKREIPEGWEVKSLGEICKVIRGVTYNKTEIRKKDDENAIGILRATNITGNKIDENDLIYVGKSLVNEKQILKPFDILITMSSGSKDHIGKNGFYLFSTENSYGAFCSKIEIESKYKNILAIYFQSDEFKKWISNTCIGTNINNLNNEHINSITHLIPSENLIENFNSITSNLFDKIKNNELQNQELSTLRDWLLPMLMNGQVSVGKDYEEVEEVVSIAAEEEGKYNK